RIAPERLGAVADPDAGPAVLAAPDIDRDDDRLRSGERGGAVDQVGLLARRRAQHHLFGADRQHGLHMIEGADAPAISEGYRRALGQAGEEREIGTAPLARRENI